MRRSPRRHFGGPVTSDLGQPGAPAATPTTTLLFDGGLVLGGVVGILFTDTRTGSAHALEGVVTVPFAAALVWMAGVGVWWWRIAGREVTRGGLAIPETIGATIFGAWVCWTAARQLAGRR